jgi:membrane protein implicated in regulation of membrane protease activity
MQSYNWLLWFAAAIIFFVIEIMTPTFFAACIGIGALAATITSFIWPSPEYVWGHFASFAAATFISFVAIRPLAKHLTKQGKKYQTNVDFLIDEVGVVTQQVGPNLNEGRVSLQGSTWRALSIDGQKIAIKEYVRVVKVKSTVLHVRPVTESREKVS